MKLPRLPITSTNSLTKAETFGGLNKTDTYVFGELSDCKNITSDNYPTLASRKGRYIAPIMGKGTVLGSGSGEEFYYVYNDVVTETAEDGTETEKRMSYFVYGGEVKGEWEDVEAKKKSFAKIGRTIYIYPDKKYYRCIDKVGTEKYLSTHQKAKDETSETCYIQLKSGSLNHNAFLAYKEDKYTPHEFGEEDAITNIEVVQKIDTHENTTENTTEDLCGISEDMKITLSKNNFKDIYFHHYSWDKSNAYGYNSARIRYKISYKYCVPEEYGEYFGSFKNDKIKVREVHNYGDCQYIIIESGWWNAGESNRIKYKNMKMEYFNNNLCEGMTVYFQDKDSKTSALIEEVGIKSFTYKLCPAFLAYLKVKAGTFDLKWTTDQGYEMASLNNTYVFFEQPELTKVCSSNNRIWGCDKDTIYASVLGKPWLYYQYNGTAADSWAVDVLSNGDFTAAFEYAGMPHFAKKDRIIKIYGTSPSTYQTSELICDGVLDGESVSLCGPCMYWLSENGVMRYTGSYPVKVSEKLGGGIISGIGAASSNKYYLYSGYADGKKALYVYDTEKGLWHCEDCGEIASAVCHDGKVYAISEDSITVLCGNELLTDEEKKKYGFLREAEFKSYAVLSDNYENTFYHKYVSKLIFRLQASEDAHIRFYLRYDNDEKKTLYYEYIGNGARDNIYIPIIPRRCDRYELSIEGEGEWKIISMARELSGGSIKKNIMR